jgi:cytochrome c oxidase cbb3-type subunit 3
MKVDEQRLLDHEYDGIREYDNPTPGWWHAIFLATVVFSIFYFIFWEFSPLAYSVQESWSQRQTAEYARVFGKLGEMTPDEATIQKMRADPTMLAVAQGIFQNNCAACHARDGGGVNGVNLTDNHYKNVKTLTDIYTTITKGANSGAMPSWEQRLLDNQRIVLAAYVANLRGTTPASARAAEGDVIPAWPEIPASNGSNGSK